MAATDFEKQTFELHHPQGLWWRSLWRGLLGTAGVGFLVFLPLLWANRGAIQSKLVAPPEAPNCLATPEACTDRFPSYVAALPDPAEMERFFRYAHYHKIGSAITDPGSREGWLLAGPSGWNTMYGLRRLGEHNTESSWLLTIDNPQKPLTLPTVDLELDEDAVWHEWALERSRRWASVEAATYERAFEQLQHAALLDAQHQIDADRSLHQATSLRQTIALLALLGAALAVLLSLLALVARKRALRLSDTAIQLTRHTITIDGKQVPFERMEERSVPALMAFLEQDGHIIVDRERFKNAIRTRIRSASTGSGPTASDRAALSQLLRR